MFEKFTTDASHATLIDLVSVEGVEEWSKTLSPIEKTYAEEMDFNAVATTIVRLPNETGHVARVALGVGKKEDRFVTAQLPKQLGKGIFRIGQTAGYSLDDIALGWALGCYKFDKYLNNDSIDCAQLVLGSEVSPEVLSATADAIFLTRDLINTPTSDMGPAQLSAAMAQLAEKHGARFSEIVGDNLLSENFPMIHAVGRASENEPRLLDMVWGDSSAPKVTLVGKGVCFDTGGLNLKTGDYMTLMKKDMGGAANVLGLASLIMDFKLKLRLRVLIPAVENSVAGNAYRPGDILNSRKGMTVEIGNTDAEGRLVLADALALADEETPEIIIDMATLTGAARVAMGPEVPPFYSDDEDLAGEIHASSQNIGDPLWRLPLWKPYGENLSSKVADINHISSGPFAGSITAALFLQKFVTEAKSWVHLDIYGWNAKARPGRPIGGEAQGIRALVKVLEDRYGRTA